VVVDGVAQPTHIGAVVGQGQLVGTGENQYCELPDVTYGLSGSSNGQGSTTLQVTSDCQLVVSSTDFVANELGFAASGPDDMRPMDPSQPPLVTSSETRGPDDD